jgi:hypothetical protein
MLDGLQEGQAGLPRLRPAAAAAAGLRLRLLDHQLQGVAWMLRQV